MTDAEREELLADLSEAFLERLRAGELITVESYAAEHQELAEELLELLPAMVDMEGLGRQSQPPAPAMAHYPERLGDYHLLERIGSGGMGTVFRARQESLNREVAVKILAPSWNSDPRQSEAFENESRVIAALRHTNIVEVFGAGQEGNYRYYVMGLVNGKGVSAGRLGVAFPGMPYERAVATVGLQAANALSFAHKNGVVHRDVKPGNLLLDNSGVLQVSDFGLATILNNGEDAPLVTQSHDGTLRYMAPERLLKGINSFAGDQYSLGLTLYELLLRRPVFKESEPGRLVQNICSGVLPRIKGHGELGAIINKASSFDPADRYASMAAMAEDLQRYLNGEPVKARSSSYWHRYVLWMRRRPAVAVWSHVAAVLVVLLFSSVSIGYARVSKALKNENEQRLLTDAALKRENEQRHLAEKNGQIADACLQRIFTSMVYTSSEENGEFAPTKADARLLLDLMPYYEQLTEQEDSKKVRDAASVLATIALKTGDYTTAENYFRRVADSKSESISARIASTVNMAVAIAAKQGNDKCPYDAIELLLELEKKVPDDADFATRLQLAKAMQLASVYAYRGASSPKTRSRLPVHRQDTHESNLVVKRNALTRRTAILIQQLAKEKPNDLQVQLRRVEMMMLPLNEEVMASLAPNGETCAALLTEILDKNPQFSEAAYLYVKLAANEAKSQSAAMGPVVYARAAKLAQSLLADNPADIELILLFLSVRDKYALQLKQQGKAEDADKENERTLAILSFLTERADFTREMREGLVKLVSAYSQHGQDRSQQEQEIRTLLQDYDEKRIKDMKLMRKNLTHPRRRPTESLMVPGAR